MEEKHFAGEVSWKLALYTAFRHYPKRYYYFHGKHGVENDSRKRSDETRLF